MLQSRKWKTICALIFVSVLAAWLLFGSNPLANANAGQSILQKQIEQLADVKQTTPSPLFTGSKPTLIKLWASWCPLCLSELQETQDWSSDPDFAGANLVTIVSPGILGEQKTDEFKQWYAGLNYPQLPLRLDPSGQLIKALGVKVYPSWAVLDAQGQLARVIKGSINKSQALALLDNPAADLAAHQGSFYQPQKDQSAVPINAKTIYLAGGCFWGVEAYFERIDGVIDAVSGYANGRTDNP
ncbi:MAG: peptide-methionine (S)-S-oxide reductase, partial [Thiopseudomonas sp.]|nr:peptide-methionine (S)-S-oxide reductase [Thiopseudomonas sp.]